MGKFKIKQTKQTLTVRCELHHFESMQEVSLDFVLPMEKNKHSACIRLDSYKTLRYILQQGVTQNDFQQLMQQVSDILKKFELAYMSLNQIVHHTDQWVYDENKKKVSFVFIKLVGSTPYLSVETLFATFLESTCFVDYQDFDWVPVFMKQAIQLAFVSKETPLNKESTHQSTTFTGLLDEEASTTALLDDLPPYFYLEQEETGEQLVITHDKMLVGHSEQADICLPHSVISRKHALLHIQDKQLYIEDLASLNKTKVNGTVLPPNESYLLSIGDKVTFANITYIVKGESQDDLGIYIWGK